MNQRQSFTTFSDEDITSTQSAMKVGLLATVSLDGLPHVTLLSSLMACGASEMCFGQFTEGMSKKHLQENPKVGFLIMSLDKALWRGKATYTHSLKDGREFDFYNNIPMFRYNAYFGVHTVYYMDLVEQTGKAPLPMNKIIFAAIQTMQARLLGTKSQADPVLNHWTRAFVDKIDNLKFLSYVGDDGYPIIVPAIQTQSLDSQNILFSTSVYTEELESIPTGIPLAVFSMALTMEDVLMRGKYKGLHRIGGVKVGEMEIDWVYNPMPPVPGQIYPPMEIKPVTQF
ncbi:MAG: pyridoxamine 5'-phosphate oxidase family protein [Anaerolineales bacterium]